MVTAVPVSASLEGTLRDLLGDRLHADRATRALYTSDASLYRALPALVVEPVDVGELSEVVRLCGESGTPVHMRGAGTSIAGNALGAGVVVVTRSLSRIVQLDPEHGFAVVEPGVVLDDLNAAVARFGLRVGPDPSTHSRCTIGGMIGNNACGAHSVAWGTTARNTLGLDVIRSDGTALRLSSPEAPRRPADPAWPELDGRLAYDLRAFTAQHEERIRQELPGWPRRVSGYALDWLLPEHGPDHAKALVGTEGTCAVVARAMIRLVRPPTARALLVLGFADDIEGAEAVPALLTAEPYTVESLSAELLGLAGATAEAAGLPRGGAWLMVEARADDSAGASDHARRLAASIGRTLESADVRFMADGPALAALWRIREDGAGHAARLADGTRGWPGFEDSAVPPERLGAYLTDLRALLRTHQLPAVSYGHYGEGCVHLRVGFGLNRPDGLGRYRRFLSEAADLVVRHGGSLSGEHGDGLARSPLLDRQFSPELRTAFAAFRAAWDPLGVLNPSIIVNPGSLTDGLRAAGPTLLRTTSVQAFSHDGGDLRVAVERCIGVGRCVATQGTAQMCPSYRATRDEQHSTRGRARLLQEMLSGSLAEEGWRSPAVREALDLCLSCRGCLSECPTGVDMAAYKAEFLDHHYRRRLRPRSHYSLGWLPLWLRLTSRMPRLVNGLTRSRLTRGLFTRAAGIAPSRSIPPLARRTFKRDWRPSSQRDTQPKRGRVVLWPDTYNDHLTPEVAHAAVRVLRDAGFEVVVPRRWTCDGLTWYTTGQLGTARRVLRHALGAPELGGDEPVVVLEPSSAAMLRADLPQLLPDDPRAPRLARRVVTFAELLDRVEYVAPPAAQDGTPAIAQPHCHHQAVLGLVADRRVWARNGIAVGQELVGCCGLAGNFGAEAGHEEIGRRVAELALAPALRAAPAAPVLADGFSCRTQVEALSGRRARHLAEVLAERLPHSKPAR